MSRYAKTHPILSLLLILTAASFAEAQNPATITSTPTIQSDPQAYCTYLTEQAKARPDVNFFGIEWARWFWRYASDRLRRNGCRCDSRRRSTPVAHFGRAGSREW